MRIYRMNEKGFTLTEIMIVSAVIVLFVLVAVTILRPTIPTAELFNAQRQTDIAELAQALQYYKKDTGNFPASIPTAATIIGSSELHYDLCPFMVPKYLRDLPVDLEGGIKVLGNEHSETEEPCSVQGVAYATGYSIVRNPDATLTINAPSATNGKIEITFR